MNSFQVFKDKHNMQKSFMATRTIFNETKSQLEG